MNTQLSNIIHSIRSIPLDDELSDDALIALSRSYISMQNLVAAHDLDSDYGRRWEFETALDSLYRICAKRCCTNQPFERRCRLTPILYMIVYMQMRVVEMKRSRECNELMRQLAEEWVTSPETHRDHMSIYGVLCCIANLYCNVSDEIRNTKSDFRWFKQQIADWVAELTNGDGHWADVQPYEALCRLEVMGHNSYIFLDDSNDEIIKNVCSYYCQSILENLRNTYGTPLRNCELSLFMLYEVLMWGVGTPDREAADAVAALAECIAEQRPYGSDEQLLCNSIVIDCLCIRINDELCNNRLANIA